MSEKEKVNRCLCGCGAPTSSSKRLFVQGHDAKLGQVVREVWAGQRPATDVPDEVWKLYEAGKLPVLDKAREQLAQSKESLETKLERERAKLNRQQKRVTKLEQELVAAKARADEQAKHKAANEKAQAKAKAKAEVKAEAQTA